MRLRSIGHVAGAIPWNSLSRHTYLRNGTSGGMTTWEWWNGLFLRIW